MPERESVLAATILIQLDADNDGSISANELLAITDEPFRNLIQSADRNHDGRITEAELAQELRLRSEQRKQLDNARRSGGVR